MAKQLNTLQAALAIHRLLHLFEIAPVSRSILATALNLRFRDFEDAVLYESARATSVDAIVTRNGKDFTKTDLSVYDPSALLAILTT